MTFPKTTPIPETHHDILVDRPTGHIATIHAEQVSAPDIPLADDPPTAPDPEFRSDGN